MRRTFFQILFQTLLTLFVLLISLGFLVPKRAIADFRCETGQLGWETSPLSMAQSLLYDRAEREMREVQELIISKPLPRANVANLKVVIPSFDIPVVLNAQVIKWMEYFQGPGRKHFIRWLSRIDQYAPMITKILREHGLPEDLVYLAMIESGFQPVAKSHARAVGMWQFMRATGRRYGLKVDWWIDERRDPLKSSLAAAQHMSDLFEEFNNWYLVAASYNAGAGKISRAIQRYNTNDFWELSKTRYLRRETKDYVPKMLAAAIIAKNPDAYGFRGLQYHEPLDFEIFQIDQFSDLRKIAMAANMSLKDLQALNPELRQPFTPPDFDIYPLRVPTGTADLLQPLQEQDQFKATQTQNFIAHHVRRRETLSSVARQYGVSSGLLADLNDVRSHRSMLYPGTVLKIPVARPADSRRLRRASYVDHSVQRNEQNSQYRVTRGDTLWSISKRFNVQVADLKRWNPQMLRSRIYAGMRLNIKKSS